nr:hypothetical protein [Tanacetum cinerariifolium]
MTLTFVETHNMIAYLTKSNASEGFNQIIDFLNGNSIKYTLTVNPNIYVSCIKQFWTSVAVKKVNDVTRLQALVDKKKVIITEATIRDTLRLDDAEGVECLPNEEIFAELARMGYEKPSTKLTFYKAFFSSQWKFLIHTILQCMSAKRTSWNEFSSSMASDVICLSSGVPAVGIVAEGDVSAANDEVPTAIAQALEITKLKQRVKKLEKRNKLKVLKLRRLKRVRSAQRINTSDDTVMDDVYKQGGIIANIDADEDIITEVVIAASTTITADDVPIPAATTAAAPTLIAAPSRMRKGVELKPLKKQAQIEQDEQYARELEAELNKNIDWDEVIDHVQRKQKEDKSNVAGFKMDYFKGIFYDDIHPIFEKYFDSNVAFLQKTKEQMDEEDSRALKRMNESQEEKATKKQKLEEEVEELKRHLQIVANDDDDDDVYTEATPLALKVPVVDYEI